MSQAKTIVDALATAISTLTSPPTVAVREQVLRLPDEALPLVILMMDDEKDEDFVFGGGVLRAYSFQCVILYKQNHDFVTAFDDAKALRDRIRNRVIPDWTASPLVVLTGVTSAYDVVAVDLPPERADEHAKGYEIARLGILVRNSEAAHA